MGYGISSKPITYYMEAIMSQYQYARIFAPATLDLYGIHLHVLALTNGDPRFTYAPLGITSEGTCVELRAPMNTKMPNGVHATVSQMNDGDLFNVIGGLRFIKRSLSGERMPTEEEALDKFAAALSAGGLRLCDEGLAISANKVRFERKGVFLQLPFWVISGRLETINAALAADTMVRGVGRSRGLGFGMLVVA